MLLPERHPKWTLIAIAIFVILFLTFLIAFLVEQSKNAERCEDGVYKTCNTSGCWKSATYMKQSMDRSIDPCTDFYEYACGRWKTENPIPDADYMYDVLKGQFSKDINQKLINLLESRIEDSPTPQATDNAKRLYQSCINTDKTEQINKQALLKTLNEIGGWPIITEGWKGGDWTWWETLAKIRFHTGYNILLETSVRPNAFNPNENIIYMQPPQPDILHGDFKASFRMFGNQKFESANSQYEEFVRQVVCFMNSTICNSKTVADDIRDLINLEKRLTAGFKKMFSPENHIKNVVYGEPIFHSPQILKSANDEDPRKTIGTLTTKYPTINWLKFFQIIFAKSGITISKDTRLLVADYTLLDNLKNNFQILSASFSTRTLCNYVLFLFVQNSGLYVSQNFRKIQFEKEKGSTGAKSVIDSKNYCVQVTASEMGFAVANMYASKYTTGEDIRYAQELIEDIKNGVRERIKTNSWLDEQTKGNAIVKLNNMAENIAFPSWVNNATTLNQYYSSLGSLSKENFVENVFKSRVLHFNKELSKLNKPVDRANDWPVRSPTTSNAFYYPNLNSFYLLLGIMSFPLFAKDSTNAVNFGGIGYIIGHEIVHGFDDTGARFNKDGKVENWWTIAANDRYSQRKRCMADLYSSFTEEISGQAINGEKTLSENIADFGGLAGSYMAFKQTVKEDIRLPGLEDMSSDKLFFISAAQVWCSNKRPEVIRYYLQADTHSPDKYRVIIPFGNSEEFLKTFQCGRNSKMTLQKKCVVF